MRDILFAIAASALVISSCHHSPKIREATLPEQIVYSTSSDAVFNAGVMFHPVTDTLKSLAIIWVHGWGVNFYSPTYVNLGRVVAEKGFTFISVNTRMHDIGNVERYKGDTRIRGGGYWGITSDQTKDIAAWIDFAESSGYKKIILVGHSAGAAAVREYESETQDKRVVGLVLASGSVDPAGAVDSSQYAQAKQLVSENKGEELITIPKRSFPSYISAGTLLDMANSPAAYKDFFGVSSANAGITKIQCPILAFYGSDDEVGNQKTLDLMKSSIEKQTNRPRSVTTAIISSSDHMYTGEEAQVAEVIIKWIEIISK